MKHAITRELLAYWNRLRAGRTAPERADIDPAAIRGILSDTFILEVDHQAQQPMFPVRLSGTRFNALFLKELKGRSLLTLFDPADRAAMLEILFSVLDDSRPVVAGLKAGPPDHVEIDLEMILLPLKHRGRTHARLLGAIAPIAVPSWLGLMPVRNLSLGSWRSIEHADEPFDRAAGSALAGRPLQKPRRYGYLVVHQGGR